MRTFASFVLFVSIMLSAFSTAQAERRVALVIGNSNYENAGKLTNPKNDAEAVSAALKRLGFEVLTGIDTDIQKMISLVRDFSKALEGADVALFYYAGHGLQVDGNNYLAPIDADLSDRADLDFGTVKLSSVMRQMNRQGAANLVFLDACRDNPLAKTLARSLASSSRSATIGRGLARVEASVGTLISYATQPGNVALDGTDGHSPFTKALLKHIETPGLDVSTMMIRVRQDVIKATEQKQVPWDHSSLTGQFYFVPREETEVAAVDLTTDNNRSANNGTTRAAQTRLQAEQSAMELAFWNTVKDTNDPDLLQTYIDRFPDGVYANLARVLKNRARAARAVDVASANPQADTDEDAPQATEGQPETTVASTDQTPGEPDTEDPGKAGKDDPEQGKRVALAKLRNKANGGDRDAALELARHYEEAGQPERAAEFAMIVIKDAGDKGADHFLSDTGAWTKDFWKALQGKLRDQSLYAGGIDGVPGQGTKRAVSSYAGIKVAQPTVTQKRRKTTQPTVTTQQPVRKKAEQPTYQKPPPNKWCQIDPNWARCTNQ